MSADQVGVSMSMSMSMSTMEEHDKRFLSRIFSAMKTVRSWDDDPELLKECRDQIPLDLLRGGNSSSSSSSISSSSISSSSSMISQSYEADDDDLYDGSALFLKRLTLYFQRSVMTWINQPNCSSCGRSDSMKFVGRRDATTDEERKGSATRVELYRCGACCCPDGQDVEGKVAVETAFPRYNSVRKLLETRRGRCGEYANLFGLYCRSVGFETRYVLDVTDHVWTEVYVPEWGRWVMADSCEGIIDKPSMYEDGWGKELSYQVAVSIDHVLDVSARYTRRWNDHDYQARRRAHTSSERQSEIIFRHAQSRMREELLSMSSEQKHQKQRTTWKKRFELLDQRAKNEMAILDSYKKRTEWTDEEKHGRGRISGSFEWKISRSEAGILKQSPDNHHENDKPSSSSSSTTTSLVQSWDVEQFFPTARTTTTAKDTTTVTMTVTSRPNDGRIVVCGVPCDVVISRSLRVKRPLRISVVVVDDIYLGCILQSRLFDSWSSLAEFIHTLPTHRIVIVKATPIAYDASSSSPSPSASSASSPSDDKNDKHHQQTNHDESILLNRLHQRLGGFPNHHNNIEQLRREGILYIGQVEARPDWTVSTTFLHPSHVGVQVRLKKTSYTPTTNPIPVLRAECGLVPRRIMSRLHDDSIMTLASQLTATYDQKRIAFQAMMDKRRAGIPNTCLGYVTKQGSPIYLFDASAFPFERIKTERTLFDRQQQQQQQQQHPQRKETNQSPLWTTHHFLPEQLVPTKDYNRVPDGTTEHPNQEHDHDHDDENNVVQIPFNTEFFTNLLGTSLLTNSKGATTTTTTIDLTSSSSLRYSRLIALYFSAHWCPPCRSFTPMLIEMYSHLREEYPYNGLEIVFVSSDRDVDTFHQYYSTMPWLAVPFRGNGDFTMQYIKQSFGVRGIPSLVVMDAMTGQIVVSIEESRKEVMQACRAGEHGIVNLVESWFTRLPPESIEIMEVLKSSLDVHNNDNDDDKNKDKDNTTGRREYDYCIRKQDADGSGGGKNGENDDDDADGGGGNKRPTDAPSLPSTKPPLDVKARIAEIFAKLVADGSDANAAAARAIQIVAEEQKAGFLTNNMKTQEEEQLQQQQKKEEDEEDDDNNNNNSAPIHSRGNLNDDDVEWEAVKIEGHEENVSRSAADDDDHDLAEAVKRLKQLDGHDRGDHSSSSSSPSSSSSSLEMVSSTLARYVDNAMRDPSNPKYRAVKLSNMMADRITRIDGGLDFALSCGFRLYSTSQDFFLAIPLDADLEALRERLG